MFDPLLAPTSIEGPMSLFGSSARRSIGLHAPQLRILNIITVDPSGFKLLMSALKSSGIGTSGLLIAEFVFQVSQIIRYR